MRLLIELIDGKERLEKRRGACRDYEEFFSRTRSEVLTDDELILRYVERVEVQEEGIDVELKAGIRVRIKGVKDIAV